MILVLTIEKVRLPTTPTSRRNGPNVHLDRAGHLGVDAALILVVQRAAWCLLCRARYDQPVSFVVAILATQRYGPVGVACAVAVTTALQNVIVFLLAGRKTGMWTQVVFSLPVSQGVVLKNR
jgi:hypothetical protein